MTAARAKPVSKTKLLTLVKNRLLVDLNAGL
jgi:hypothetical protein